MPSSSCIRRGREGGGDGVTSFETNESNVKNPLLVVELMTDPTTRYQTVSSNLYFVASNSSMPINMNV